MGNESPPFPEVEWEKRWVLGPDDRPHHIKGNTLTSPETARVDSKATPWVGCLASPKTARILLHCPKTARMDSKATPWVHSLASPKTARILLH